MHIENYLPLFEWYAWLRFKLGLWFGPMYPQRALWMTNRWTYRITRPLYRISPIVEERWLNPQFKSLCNQHLNLKKQNKIIIKSSEFTLTSGSKFSKQNCISDTFFLHRCWVFFSNFSYLLIFSNQNQNKNKKFRTCHLNHKRKLLRTKVCWFFLVKILFTLYWVLCRVVLILKRPNHFSVYLINTICLWNKVSNWTRKKF